MNFLPIAVPNFYVMPAKSALLPIPIRSTRTRDELCRGSLSYSPWCVPTAFGDVKCVIVNRDLRDYDVMAWDFCMNFAKDNDLQVELVAPVAGRS